MNKNRCEWTFDELRSVVREHDMGWTVEEVKGMATKVGLKLVEQCPTTVCPVCTKCQICPPRFCPEQKACPACDNTNQTLTSVMTEKVSDLLGQTEVVILLSFLLCAYIIYLLFVRYTINRGDKKLE